MASASASSSTSPRMTVGRSRASGGSEAPSPVLSSPPTSPIPAAPPPPPADFNPPADLTNDTIEQAISAITSPPPSHDGTPVMSGHSSPVSMMMSMSRPALQALQRVSHDSSTSAGSAASGTSAGGMSATSDTSMDGQDHLTSMRDRLIESSGGPSREVSMEDVTMDVTVTEATPPQEPTAGPSRQRSQDEEQAWDSVWPTAETVQRAANTSLAEASRFPITAPVSPFVTPSFSPAVIGRASPASRRPHSPQAPEPPFNAARRRSVSFEPSAQSPTLSATPVSISKHQRSFSSSSASPTGRHFKATPPSSPLNRASSPQRKPRARGQSVSLAPETQAQAGPSRSPRPELRNDDVPSLDRLPPPVTPPNVAPFQSKDDLSAPMTPLYTPLARPANLRRALSDFDPKSKNSPPPLPRSTSLELDKTTKRTPFADLPSPVDPTEVRPKKSPRLSPNPLPAGHVDLVDEGDVLPQDADLYMDVTFEDEGLTTLERIFLLSKSEFPFHRNYIARVLGDLLYDVDPCESVEYILPLISSFPVDEDEGVREAFAQELHRILWYYFATCRVKDGTDDRPYLPVDFFTPLLGSLLLNSNTIVTDCVRTGLVSILSRLKGGDVTVERWGPDVKLDGDKAYPSQVGEHQHHHAPIPDDEREMIEIELFSGIVIGMGSLSTELPDEIYADDQAEEQELFQAQLLAEATAGQATSMNLIGSLCEFYTGDEAVDRGFVEEVLRCADAEVPGRAEGAIALAALAKIVPADEIPRLTLLFEHLSRDESVQVRQSLCVALPALCRRLEMERREFAIAAIHNLAPDVDVRNSLLDVLGELIYAFHEDPAGPPVEIMRVYLEEEENEDWDTVAAFNVSRSVDIADQFPAVVLTLGPSRWPELRNLYARLNERATAKPRRSLAASLHELAKILTPEQCAADLVPVYQACLDTDEIRELVFERVDILLSHLPIDDAWKIYLDLARGWRENRLGGWRAREQLALRIPAFFRIFCDRMRTEVLDMLHDALLDPFAAVRDAATKGIPESYEVLGDSEIAGLYRDTLLELGKSSKFRQRLTFVRCLREFVKPPPNRQAFEEFFLPFLHTLATDVVDVRLGLAQSVADLFVVGAYYGRHVHAPQAIYALARQLAQDEAVDVRETVRNVDLDHLKENDSVPYEVKTTEAVKRSVTPSDLEPLGKAASVREGKQGSSVEGGAGASTDTPPVVLTSPPETETTESARPESTRSLSSNVDSALGMSSVTGSGASSAGSGSSAVGSSADSARSAAGSSASPVPPPGPARTQSSEMMTHLTRMVLRTPTSEFPPALSPFFSASAHHTPRTPGGGLYPPSTPGSYVSSPSPNEPSHGQDPFSHAFGTATPEMVAVASPAGSVASLRSEGG